MGPTLAATEEGTLVEEAGGKHEDARMAAVVGQQRGSMGCGGLLKRFVAGEEPFQDGVSQSILPCYVTENCYLWAHLHVGNTHTTLYNYSTSQINTTTALACWLSPTMTTLVSFMASISAPKVSGSGHCAPSSMRMGVKGRSPPLLISISLS